MPIPSPSAFHLLGTFPPFSYHHTTCLGQGSTIKVPGGDPSTTQGNELLKLMIPLSRELQTCLHVGLHHLQAMCCS